MDTKIANITVDHSKPGYIIIKKEDWEQILSILTEGGAEIDHYTEGGMINYFKYIADK